MISRSFPPGVVRFMGKRPSFIARTGGGCGDLILMEAYYPVLSRRIEGKKFHLGRKGRQLSENEERRGSFEVQSKQGERKKRMEHAGGKKRGKSISLYRGEGGSSGSLVPGNY